MTEPPGPEDVKTPLSFKVMVGLAVLYLGWRLVEALIWVWNQVF